MVDLTTVGTYERFVKMDVKIMYRGNIFIVKRSIFSPLYSNERTSEMTCT